MSLSHPEPEEAPWIWHFACDLEKFNEEFGSTEPTRSKKFLSKYEWGELATLWKTGDSWGASKGQMLMRITNKDGTVVGIYDYRKDVKVFARVWDEWLSIDDERAKTIPKDQKEVKVVNNNGEELLMLWKSQK